MDNKSKRVSLIFCQSPIKIGAVLVCYEKEKADGNDVMIIARNTKSIYEFINSLHLDAQVYWFDNHLSITRNLWKKNRIINIIKKDIKSLNVSENEIVHIYFSSICNDLLMGCYLAQFDKNKIIKLQGAIDIQNKIDNYTLDKEKEPIRLKIKKHLFSYLLGYKIRIQTVGIPVLAIDMGYYRYPMFDGSDQAIYEKYLYQLETSNKKAALVFASGFPESFRNRDDYVSVFVRCIKELQNKGYSVFIKGHPRLGTLREALDCSITEIPAYIPAEFIDYKSFSCAFGLMTAAICSTSFRVPSYCILPLSGFVKDERYDGWCNYLNKASKGQLKYLYSFEDIP